MTKTEVLAFVRELRAGEQSDAVLLCWLEELEKKIALEIHGQSLEYLSSTAVTREQLSVKAPYDRVYWTYLVSMLDFVSGNLEVFDRSNRLFKEAYADYARFMQRHKYQAKLRNAT